MKNMFWKVFLFFKKTSPKSKLHLKAVVKIKLKRKKKLLSKETLVLKNTNFLGLIVYKNPSGL